MTFLVGVPQRPGWLLQPPVDFLVKNQQPLPLSLDLVSVPPLLSVFLPGLVSQSLWWLLQRTIQKCLHSMSTQESFQVSLAKQLTSAVVYEREKRPAALFETKDQRGL